MPTIGCYHDEIALLLDKPRAEHRREIGRRAHFAGKEARPGAWLACARCSGGVA